VWLCCEISTCSLSVMIFLWCCGWIWFSCIQCLGSISEEQNPVTPTVHSSPRWPESSFWDPISHHLSESVSNNCFPSFCFSLVLPISCCLFVLGVTLVWLYYCSRSYLFITYVSTFVILLYSCLSLILCLSARWELVWCRALWS